MSDAFKATMSKMPGNAPAAQQEAAFMSIGLDQIRITLAIVTMQERLQKLGVSTDAVMALTDDELTEFLLKPESRHLVNALTEGAGFKDAEVLKLECEDKFNWEMKLKMQDYMQKVHHRYRVHFVPSPREIFKDLDELELDKKEVLQDAQLALLSDERDAKIEKINKQIEDAVSRLNSLRADLPEISFEGTVIESKWPDDGTVLRIKLPAVMVNILNENRMYVKDGRYFVRLEKIGD